MAKELVDALVPIFAGLLLGFWAGRRGLMDNFNVRNLIALVMNIAAPCALFLIINNTSRAILQQQIWTSLAITLTFAVLYIGCYFWARRNTNSVSESAVIALTFAFPNEAAIAVSLLTTTYGHGAAVPGALSIAIGAVAISPVTLALLEVDSQGKATTIGVRTLAGGVVRSLTRPIIWAPALALVLVSIGIHIPDYVASTLGLIGGAAAGGALLLTGLILSAQPFTLNGPVLVISFAKLILQPMLAFGIALAMPVSHQQVRDITLISAIPGGFFGIVFGKSFNTIPEVASSGLIATYGLAIVTLPLWIFLLSRFM
jgi:malonate transporter and related proteins